VPVTGRSGNDLGGDIAAGAGTVVNDYRLAERLTELGREYARERIGAAARCERQHEPDRTRRVGLGRGV
jgi:hypothetical protein